MNSDLNKQVADALVADRMREAERFRRSRSEWGENLDHQYETVTVRLARPVEHGALARLAELDGGRVPQGSVLVAEVGGSVLAARSLENGASVADPFRPTAHLIELLELRSIHLRNAANGRIRPRQGVLAWLRARVREWSSG